MPTVDLTSEYLEVERRRYHARVRADLIDRGAVRESVEKALERAAPKLQQKGWRITERGSD